jgi:hypothetical protein
MWTLSVILHSNSPASQLAAATSSSSRRRWLLLHSTSSCPLFASSLRGLLLIFASTVQVRLSLVYATCAQTRHILPLHVGSIRREPAVPGGSRGRDRRQRRCVIAWLRRHPSVRSSQHVVLVRIGVLSCLAPLIRLRWRPGQASTNCSASRVPSRRA